MINLSGRWKGQYKYGKGYSPQDRGRVEPFEFYIVDSSGSIGGSCYDAIVEKITGNESYIIGHHNGKTIHFKKRYKLHVNTDGEAMDGTVQPYTTDGIDYSGKIHRGLFSKQLKVVGTWKITYRYKDEFNQPQEGYSGGTWRMVKLEG